MTDEGNRQALELHALQHRHICWLEVGEFRLRRDEHEKDHHVGRLWEGNQPVALQLLLAVGRGEGRDRLHHHRATLDSIHTDRLDVAHRLHAVGALQLLHQLRRDVINADPVTAGSRGVDQYSTSDTVRRDSRLRSDGEVVGLMVGIVTGQFSGCATFMGPRLVSTIR